MEKTSHLLWSISSVLCHPRSREVLARVHVERPMHQFLPVTSLLLLDSTVKSVVHLDSLPSDLKNIDEHCVVCKFSEEASGPSLKSWISTSNSTGPRCVKYVLHVSYDRQEKV